VLTVRGYFGIGILNSKKSVNLGTLWRSAYQLGASFIFTIGRRYSYQSSDTCKTTRHVPYHAFESLGEFRKFRPIDCQLIGVEMDGTPVERFWHPERAIYLLGAEDHGLTKEALEECQDVISLSSERMDSFNVAVAGSIVLYQRHLQFKPVEVIGHG